MGFRSIFIIPKSVKGLYLVMITMDVWWWLNFTIEKSNLWVLREYLNYLLFFCSKFFLYILFRFFINLSSEFFDLIMRRLVYSQQLNCNLLIDWPTINDFYNHGIYIKISKSVFKNLRLYLLLIINYFSQPDQSSNNQLKRLANCTISHSERVMQRLQDLTEVKTNRLYI